MPSTSKALIFAWSTCQQYARERIWRELTKKWAVFLGRGKSLNFFNINFRVEELDSIENLKKFWTIWEVRAPYFQKFFKLKYTRRSNDSPKIVISRRQLICWTSLQIKTMDELVIRIWLENLILFVLICVFNFFFNQKNLTLIPYFARFSNPRLTKLKEIKVKLGVARTHFHWGLKE